MGGYLDGTSEHKGWFEGGRQSVYKERLFGGGGFPFLLSLLILLYTKAITTLKQLWFLHCLDFLDTNFEAVCPDYEIAFFLPISPRSDPARYTKYFWRSDHDHRQHLHRHHLRRHHRHRHHHQQPRTEYAHVHQQFVGRGEQIPLENLSRRFALPKIQLYTFPAGCRATIVNTNTVRHHEISWQRRC